MARLPAGPSIVALLGCLGAAALGLTTYTLPIEGAASDPDLARLLHAALHDSVPTIAAVAAVLPVEAAPFATVESAQPAPRLGLLPGRDSTVAANWLTAAVATDSSAVRDWLGRWVWATALTEGGTFRLTLHRVSLRAGCPWVSRLDAVTSRVAGSGTPRLRVTGTCPRLKAPMPSPAS